MTLPEPSHTEQTISPIESTPSNSESAERPSFRPGTTIHQIFYRDEQIPYLDPLLKPWDNRQNLRPEWCEYWVMRLAWQEKEKHFTDLTGFLSWKFREKLEIDAAQIFGFLQAHPGADCYIICPAVFQTAFFLNVWQQGEYWHPGLIATAQNLLDALGIKADLAHSIDHHLTTAFTNSWIARPSVWKAYFAFMEPVFAYIEAQKNVPGSPFWQNRYLSSGGDAHIQALPLIPYLIERLFSVFIKSHPEFRVVAWEFPFHALQERAHLAAGLVPLANWCKLLLQRTGHPLFLEMFQKLQNEMLLAMNRTKAENPGAVFR